mmetsp:Transcript_6159/g.15700  ORF Transcript_6159/g.15700 Transcript_6159/m.15700 type:complete len:157 (+) Transcript_6159:246-716(+)
MRRFVALRPRPRPPQSTRPRPRRALTSTKERSKTSREDDQRLYYRAKMDGALNDEPTKKPMLDAVLGAAVALFFGGGTYALFLNSGGSCPSRPILRTSGTLGGTGSNSPRSETTATKDGGRSLPTKSWKRWGITRPKRRRRPSSRRGGEPILPSPK